MELDSHHAAYKNWAVNFADEHFSKRGENFGSCRRECCSADPNAPKPVLKGTHIKGFGAKVQRGGTYQKARRIEVNDSVYVCNLSEKHRLHALNAAGLFDLEDGTTRPLLLYTVLFNETKKTDGTGIWLLKSLNHSSQVITVQISEELLFVVSACSEVPCHDTTRTKGTRATLPVAKTLDGSIPSFCLSVGPDKAAGDNFGSSSQCVVFPESVILENITAGTGGYFLPCVPRNHLFGQVPNCSCKDFHCMQVLRSMLCSGVEAGNWKKDALDVLMMGDNGKRRMPDRQNHNYQWICLEPIDSWLEAGRDDDERRIRLEAGRDDDERRKRVERGSCKLEPSMGHVCAICEEEGKKVCSGCMRVHCK